MADATTMRPCQWPIDDRGMVWLKDIDPSAPCLVGGQVSGIKVQMIDAVEATSAAEIESRRQKMPSLRVATTQQEGTTMEDAHAEQPLLAVADEPVPMLSTQSADAAMPDLSAFLPKDGQVSPLTVILIALVLLAGLAYRFGPSLARARHEREMRRLEVEEKKVEKNDSHEKCSVERSALAARLDEAHGRLNALEHRVEQAETKIVRPMGFGDDDVEQLREDLRKLQRMAKSQKAKAKATATRKRGV